MTNATPTLLQSIEVPLQVPIPIKSEGGADRQIAKIVLHRPKARHAKRLAVIIGPHIIQGFLDTEEVQKEVLAGRVVEALMTDEKLDAIFELVADLAREDLANVNELDLVDLMAVGKAFVGFFPALQSAVLTSAAVLSPQRGTGNHPN